MNEFIRNDRGDEYVEVCMDWVSGDEYDILCMFKNCFDKDVVELESFKNKIKEVFDIE